MEHAYKKIKVLSHNIQLYIISHLHLLAAAEDIEASHAFEDRHGLLPGKVMAFVEGSGRV